MNKRPAAGFTTRLVHHGEPHPRFGDAIAMPIFQSATYAFSGASSDEVLRYSRLNNTPNHVVLHAKLANLEGAEAALVTASGMAAIATGLLAVLKAGDHLLIQETLYGGTDHLVTHELVDLGIEVTRIAMDQPDGWEAHLRETTRAIYVESISNPTMAVPDHEAVVAFARHHRLTAMIDNTFASPVNFRPAEWGYDLSLHSATKYINGHSDLTAGAIIGRRDLIEHALVRLNHLGGTLDPHACFLLHRGMKTLALRVERQNASALEIAQYLDRHPAVLVVNYPGLSSHPSHDQARRYFDGYGGMVSFVLDGGLDAVHRFMERLRVAVVAPSLGGVETLVSSPALTSHRTLEPPRRNALGIPDGMVRMSVGIEDSADLVADVTQALDSVSTAR